LLLPPAGEVVFDTHWTPVSVEANVATVDLAAARTLLGSPAALRSVEAQAPQLVRDATQRAAVYAGGSALLGAGVLACLVYRRRWRRTAVVVAGVAGLLVTVTGATVGTFAPDRLAQPRFTGLLSQAPYVAGQTGSLLARLESYRSGVGDLVQAVTTLYAMSGRLPVVAPSGAGGDVVTVLHVSDLHLNPIGFDLVGRLVREFHVDVVVDSGDITTWGTDVESSTLSWIGDLGVPYVFVRGNHDSRRTQAVVASFPNAVVLDGTVAEVDGLVIAGIGDPVFTPDTAGGAPSPSPSSAAARADAPPPDPELAAGTRLAEVISSWNRAHPDRPVSLAVVHEPYAVPPLLGAVPLVLDGHFHAREVEVDEKTGTWVMREGTTGGAGISADFQAIEQGQPLPLEATLLHVARGGERAGQVVAYDEVTVGGFGLASASVKRTVVPPPQGGTRPSPSPAAVPSRPAPSGTVASPS
jgi:predicted MPP superfamily phosphohydrolase